MSSHRAIPVCTVPKAPKTTGITSVRQCHMWLISTRKSLYFANFSASFLPMLPSAGQLISIRRQVFVFLFLRQMSGRLALIFLAVGMVVSHIIVMSSVSTLYYIIIIIIIHRRGLVVSDNGPLHSLGVQTPVTTVNYESCLSFSYFSAIYIKLASH